MDEDAILEKLKTIVAKVFKVDKSNIARQTKQEDLEKWDSLGHIVLLLEIEKEFGLKFELQESLNMNSVENLLESIMARLG